MSLAENLRALRENRRLLQRDVAEGSEIPYGTYVSYERAEVEAPPVLYVYRMARFFEITMEELLGLEPLSAGAARAALRDNKLLRERLEAYEAFAIAMPYIERAHRDMGRLLETIENGGHEDDAASEAA